MVIDLLIFVIGSFLYVLFGWFSLIPFVLPDEFEQAVEYYAGHLAYLGGVINVPDLMTALGVLLSFIFWWYVFKLSVWIYRALPFVGKNIGTKT